MIINQHNYEAYLLDYTEGRLDELSVLVLKDFLHHHPELGSFDELTALMPSLEAEPVRFAGRDALMKEPIIPVGNTNETNYEHTFIAYHEGLLSLGAKAETHAFIQKNSFLKADFECYAKTRLQADPAIVYTQKSKLKRRAIFWGRNTYKAVAVAASLLLLITASWWGMRISPETPRTEAIALGLPALKPAYTLSLQPAEIPLKTRLNPQAPDETRELPAIRETIEIPTMLAMKQAGNISVTHMQADQKLHFVPDGYLYDFELFYATLHENRENENRTAIGALFAGTSRIARNLFNRQIAEPIYEVAPEAGISLWDIASLGVRTYNTLMDREVELTAAHGPEGNVVAYRLRSDRFQITRRLDE